MQGIVGLNFVKHGDARVPVTSEIQIFDEDDNLVAQVRFTPEQFVAFLSGSVQTLRIQSDLEKRMA